MTYQPPFTITAKILNDVVSVTEELSRLSVTGRDRASPRLRRINRLRSIHSSLAIEGNGLGIDEVTEVIDGKAVAGPARELQEVKNAAEAYSVMDSLDPYSPDDLVRIHDIFVKGLSENGLRKGNEGIFDMEGRCIHLAPPAEFVPGQISDLLMWLRTSDQPMIIRSCVFHYEFESIHPFTDGNGRTGRLWQTLILSKWNRIFEWIPVESVILGRQNEYYGAISASNDNGECTRFIEFMLEIILESVRRFAKESNSENIPAELVLSPSEAAVYKCISDGLFGSIKNASLILGISEPTVARAVRSLRDRHIITRIGSNKTGRWFISDTEYEI